MFLAIRIVIGLGLIATLWYTVAYFLMGNYRHLVIALRILLVTFVVAIALGAGIWLETLSR